MAEITRDNYLQLIPKIKEQLRTAAFVSFDGEFSGLGQPPGESKTSLFDTGADRYAKLRKIVIQNTTPQIGFCIFGKDENPESNSFHVEAYQAYVTEARFGDFNMTGRLPLSLEYKCSKFLRKCNVNFNALLENSVPYLNNDRMHELELYMQEHPNFLVEKPKRYFNKKYFPERKELVTQEDRRKMAHRLRGLSEIVDTIKHYQIPIVGHNMSLDLLHFFQMFCADLPEDYDTFKTLISQHLPCIYDTKFMILTCKRLLHSHPAYKNNQDKDKLESSTLFLAYLNTSKLGDRFRPKVNLSPSCQHFDESIRLGLTKDLETEADSLIHNPAFDACITGLLFLNVAHITARIEKSFGDRTKPFSLNDIMDNVESYRNQVFISRASVSALYLSGYDPKPCRPRWTEARSGRKVDLEIVKQHLSSFGLVDVEQLDEYTIRFAAAGGKSARQIKTSLQKQGFTLKNINIPNVRNVKVSSFTKSKVDSFYDQRKLMG